MTIEDLTGPVSDVATHIGARDENQDCWARWTRGARGAIFVVADGLGGHQAGREAARIAAEAAVESYREPFPDPLAAAKLAVDRAAAALAESRRSHGDDRASTLVVLVLNGGRAGWAWCGDSRIYRERSGAVERLTEDHSAAMVSLPPELRASADVRGDPARNRLVSVLGEDEPLIGSGSDDLHAQDRFVLCSDGYWEGSSRGEIAAALAAGESAETMLQAVLAKGRERQDNLTLLVVRG